MGQQFSSRTIFFLLGSADLMGSRCFVGTRQCHQAISRSQTSARPPRLLPSWLADGDSWAATPQPAACLIFLYFVISLFLFIFLIIFTSFEPFYFMPAVLAALKMLRCQSEYQTSNQSTKSRSEYHLYYNLNEFLGLHSEV